MYIGTKLPHRSRFRGVDRSSGSSLRVLTGNLRGTGMYSVDWRAWLTQVQSGEEGATGKTPPGGNGRQGPEAREKNAVQHDRRAFLGFRDRHAQVRVGGGGVNHGGG